MSPRRTLTFNGAAIDVEALIRETRVTDHALVRWLERIEGYPVDQLRRSIISRPAILQGLALGASAIQLPDLGARLVIDQRRIVTVTNLGDRS